MTPNIQYMSEVPYRGQRARVSPVATTTANVRFSRAAVVTRIR